MAEGIGFLVGDTGRLMRRRFDEAARSLGITGSQGRALFVLSRREGLSQAALAEQLEVEPITLCRMIDRLVHAGQVERRRDPADRRAWRLYLTDTSRPLIDRLRDIAEVQADAALDGLPTGERTTLIAALWQIRTNLLRPRGALSAG